MENPFKKRPYEQPDLQPRIHPSDSLTAPYSPDTPLSPPEFTYPGDKEMLQPDGLVPPASAGDKPPRLNMDAVLRGAMSSQPPAEQDLQLSANPEGQTHGDHPAPAMAAAAYGPDLPARPEPPAPAEIQSPDKIQPQGEKQPEPEPERQPEPTPSQEQEDTGLFGPQHSEWFTSQQPPAAAEEEATPPPTDNSGGGNDKPPQPPSNSQPGEKQPEPTPEQYRERAEEYLAGLHKDRKLAPDTNPADHETRVTAVTKELIASDQAAAATRRYTLEHEQPRSLDPSVSRSNAEIEQQRLEERNAQKRFPEHPVPRDAAAGMRPDMTPIPDRPSFGRSLISPTTKYLRDGPQTVPPGTEVTIPTSTSSGGAKYLVPVNDTTATVDDYRRSLFGDERAAAAAENAHLRGGEAGAMQAGKTVLEVNSGRAVGLTQYAHMYEGTNFIGVDGHYQNKPDISVNTGAVPPDKPSIQLVHDKPAQLANIPDASIDTVLYRQGPIKYGGEATLSAIDRVTAPGGQARLEVPLDNPQTRDDIVTSLRDKGWTVTPVVLTDRQPTPTIMGVKPLQGNDSPHHVQHDPTEASDTATAEAPQQD